MARNVFDTDTFAFLERLDRTSLVKQYGLNESIWPIHTVNNTQSHFIQTRKDPKEKKSQSWSVASVSRCWQVPITAHYNLARTKQHLHLQNWAQSAPRRTIILYTNHKNVRDTVYYREGKINCDKSQSEEWNPSLYGRTLGAGDVSVIQWPNTEAKGSYYSELCHAQKLPQRKHFQTEQNEFWWMSEI